MDDEFKLEGTIESYRNYYNKDKRHLFKWTNRDVPYWIKEEYN